MPTATFTQTYANNCTSLADWSPINGPNINTKNVNPPFQSPRLPSNVVVLSGGSAPAGTTNGSCIAVYSRADTTHGYPGNWANGGVQMHQPGSHYVEARYEFRCMFTGGTNTKGVYLLWPDVNTWSGCPNNSAVEQDMVEWNGSGTGAGSNLHYKTTVTSPSFQDQLGKNGGLTIGGVAIDWSTWHVVVFDNTSSYITMTVDGSVVDGYPITRARNLPQTSFFFGFQTAMIGASRTVSHTTCTAYLDYLKVYKKTGSGPIVGPGTPQNVAVPSPNSASANVTWSAAQAGSFPIAGYNVLVGPHGGSLTKNNSLLVQGTSYNITGLTASTSYDVEVQSQDTESSPLTATSPIVTFTTQAGTVVGPQATFSVSPTSTYSGVSSSATAVLTAGSVTSASIDWGDGSAQWTGTSVPSGVTHTWSNSSTSQPDGVFYVTLNLSDGVNAPFTAIVPVTVGDQQQSQVQLIQQGDALDQMWRTINAAFTQILSGSVGNFLPAQAYWVNGGIGGLQWGQAGDSYPRTILDINGNFWTGGDGTWDITTAPALMGPNGMMNVAAPTPGNGFASFIGSASNNSGGSGSTTASVVLPANIVSGSYALLAVQVKSTTAPTTPSGWTLIQLESNTGNATNDQLAVYGKVVGSSDSSTTQNVTVPNVLWTCGVAVYGGVSGVDVSAGQLNAQTGQTSHPLPGLTTTGANEFVVGISGCRFTSTAGTNINAGTGLTQRVQDASTSSTANDVAFVIADQLVSTAGAVTMPSSTTGSGAYSTGITVALTTSGSAVSLPQLLLQMLSTTAAGVQIQGIASGTGNPLVITDSSGNNQFAFSPNTVLFVGNTTSVPASNPVGGGYLYVQGGALKYRGSSGTVTTIANA